VEYGGAVYHVMCRGNGGQAIFADDPDRRMFLNTLGEVCGRCGWRVHAYVLMGNHYHLLLETPEPNLVVGMKWFQGTYTQRFNSRHRRWGHLFQGRYKALPVHADEAGYWEAVSSYIHLNPARAQLFDLQNGNLSNYPWSSYPAYVRPATRPPWLFADRVLNALHMADSAAGRTAYRRFMKKRVLEILHSDNPRGIDEGWKDIRRGWFLGSNEFKEKLEELIDGRMVENKRSSYSGEEVDQHDERMAEALLQAGWEALDLDENEVLAGKKGTDEKCLLAWLVRRHTHIPNAWISERLKMGRPDCLSRYPQRIETTRDRRLLRLRGKLEIITKLRD
jgi:REP element-mobilizing transposase RayT